jgi:4-oxalomesaconate tautomerase
VFVDKPLVSAARPCGTVLAAVGPAAIERGLVAARDGVIEVFIHILNSGEVAVARVNYHASARKLFEGLVFPALTGD